MPAVFFIAWLYQHEQDLLAATLWAVTFAVFGSAAAALKLCFALAEADGDMARFWTSHQEDAMIRVKEGRGGKIVEAKEKRDSQNTHFTRSAGPAKEIRM